MKSESASKEPANSRKWRREKTLKRDVSFRPIEDEDIKYAWAAYKKGALSSMGFTQEMTVDEFKLKFESFVLANHHGAWTLMAPTSKGKIPVGIVLAAWAPNATFMIVNGACWFPWASNRNILEAIVCFLSEIRRDLQLVFYALPEHKRIYEVCCMHGVIRRSGTSFVAFPGKQAAVYETRPI